MFDDFDLPNPGGSLGRDVQDLLAKVGLADLESTILRIAAETYTDPTNANLSLTVIDATIGARLLEGSGITTKYGGKVF